MTTQQKKTVPVAVIGLGAVMPDANDFTSFWQNIRQGRNSIREVPPERWRIEDHYDPDRSAPDKSYCKIGAFVSGFEFNPLGYRIPPRVAASMDEVQKWAVDAAHQALVHAGYEDKDFDRSRTAVVIGNAMAGEMQYITNLRVYFPRYARALAATDAFRQLSTEVQQRIMEQFHQQMTRNLPPITEDSMPGELSNVIAGRVANVFGLRGPNYTADAACASSLAALESALGGLAEQRYDMALTGGVDSSMAPHSFVKFCKIGALSADGSFPFDRRANGFVMGEGCGIMLLKRLEDAERDGDRILAVIHGIGSSSDGKGKGITAPNPEGQRLAIERAYRDAGISPAEVTMIEAHGTATMAGDRVEGNVMTELFSRAGVLPHSVAMGSVKSQIGHLKSAAGAAALIKAVMSIHEGVIPASLNFETPNPEIPFARSPAFVPTELMPWKTPDGKPRLAGVSSFGFGGSNFHVVLGEHRPDQRPKVFVDGGGGGGEKQPPRKLLAVGGNNVDELKAGLQQKLAEPGDDESLRLEAQALQAPERLVIEYGDAEQRKQRGERALSALASDDLARWRALTNQGVFRGSGRPPRVAFLFPGQGSQYLGMLAELRASEPVVAETFREADAIMEPILGRTITSYIDREDTPQAREALRDTNVCQPAMLAADIALLRMFEQYGLHPDMVAGHSMGEYAALVAAGMLSFAEAMRAVSSRAREMSSVRVDDPGKMAAVLAPRDKIQPIIDAVEGVVPANLNSFRQTVIAGATAPMNEALRLLKEANLRAVELQVSHAFHSYIVAPATKPLRRMLDTFDFQPPRIPLFANVDARPYSADPADRAANLDRLAQQIASPVRWIETIQNMYERGARIFIEVGAKRVLANLTADIIDDPQVLSVAANNPKLGDWPSFAMALAALAAAGHPRPDEVRQEVAPTQEASNGAGGDEPADQADVRPAGEESMSVRKHIVISGAGLGLPGADNEVFAEDNTERILSGQVLIDPVPGEQRRRLAGQRIVRLVKDAPGGPVFEVIDSSDKVARLLGRKGRFDLAREFGLDENLVASYDVTTRLAIAAGLLALRDAGIPLVMKHKPTTTGGRLPLGYRLPDSMADETGIIFASAFPGYEQLVQEMERRQRDELLAAQIEQLKKIVDEVGPLHAVTRRLEELKKLRGEPFGLDRKFIFRALSFGHAQFAELVGARGPNVQVNAACSSTTLAVSMAADWIRLGRCRRVLVVGADDITNPTLAPWLVGGLLATGAVTSEEKLELAALPFDRRRNGMIPGMGAVGLVVEEEDACAQRGMRGIARLLGSVLANSAYHGTRLDTEHIAEMMDRLVSQVEREHGLDRKQLAGQTVFVSHETYTPARGGSAAAEIKALRRTFGDRADEVVVANTKGYTGHPMGVGIEDAVAVKMLERETVPPIPNLQEPDPELGRLNLSRGGHYDVRYALRLAAGFGSQVTMTLMEKIPGSERIADRERHQAWLAEIAGRPDARLEVVNKTLRIHDEAAGLMEQHRNAGAAPAERQQPAVEPAVTEKRQQVVETGAKEQPPVTEPAAETTEEVTATTEPQVAGEEAGKPVEAAAAAVPGAEEVREKILAIVAEKTGYPPEMLELDLDLEADLGIDTVKQAEMFSEVRAAFGIPKQDDLKLSDYPTLGHIIEFALGKLGEAGGGTVTAAGAEEQVAGKTAGEEVTATTEPQVAGEEAGKPVEAAAAAVPGAEEVREKILAIVAEKTGYPPEMLELDLDLEADLGIDTVKQAEMFSEVRAAFGIPKQDDLKLSDYPTLGHIIEFALGKLGEAGGGAVTAAGAEEQVAGEPVAEAAGEEVTGTTTKQPRVAEEEAGKPVEAAAAAVPGAEEVREKILAIVAEKTGYPPEMLELDLDLEADLGIDTVKQAEMFSEVRAAFGIPKQDDLKLSDYPTLGHIIEFALGKLGEAGGGAVTAAGAEERVAGEPVAEAAGEEVTGTTTKQPRVAEEEAGKPVEVAAAAVPGADEVREKILAIVAEKTGYPPEMLELDLDLEADLGIDTVKQAEMFSEVRAAFGIPKQDDLKLSDYPTLGHIIEFALGKIGESDRTGGGSADAGEQEISASDVAEEVVNEPLDSIPAASEQVRYLAPVLVGRPRARECLPTGVELGGRSIVVGREDDYSRRLLERLRQRGGDPVFVDASGTPDEVADRVGRLARQTRPRGVWLLTAIDEAAAPGASDEQAWQRAVERRAKLPFRVAKAVDGLLGDNAFFIAAVKVGGQLGLRPGGRVVDPVAGATCGLVKSLAKEWSDVLCKVVDLPVDADPEYCAATLLEEAERDGGVVEVTRLGIRRWGVGLTQLQPLPPEQAQAGSGGLDRPDPVVLITGGAGDITGRIARDLAENLKGSYYLADLMPEPAADDPDIKLLAEDRTALQRTILTRLRASNEKVTPVMVEHELNLVERRAAALRNLQALRECGAQASQVQLDVTDPAAVERVIGEIVSRHGRLDYILHAAGLERSQSLGRKRPETFDLVFDVKVQGLHALLRATRNVDLRGLMLFGSVAGRFGNAGQTDYAAANDLFSKCAAYLRAARPGLQAFVLAYSGWDGAGMATRGSIPQQLAAAGINLIPLEEGAPSVRRALASGIRGEVVVARSLGVLHQGLCAPGVDLAVLEQRLQQNPERFPLLGRPLDWTLVDGLRLEVEFDPHREKFLDDHRIDGVAVLPGVMAVETFAEAALLMRPDLEVVAIEDLVFEAPLKFYRDETRRALVRMVPGFDESGRVIVATMETERQLHGGVSQRTRHYRARIRLDGDRPRAQRPHQQQPGQDIGREDIYRLYFHGPSFQVLDGAGMAADDGELYGWMKPGTEQPLMSRHGATCSNPMYTELAFQAAGLLEARNHQRLGLPAGVRRLVIHRDGQAGGNGGRVAARVLPLGENGSTSYRVAVVDDQGRVLVELDGYRTARLPGELPEEIQRALGGKVEK